MATVIASKKPAALDITPDEIRVRFDRAMVDPEQISVDEKGGRYNAGLLSGVSLIARGEALGHGFWIDSDMLSAVAELAAGSAQGVKSRFTHPDMSNDGLGRHLGRIFDASVPLGEDRVRGDLHFGQASRNAPEGDLAGHVLTLAGEDPAAAGLSIVFERDRELEVKFMLANGAKIDEGGYLDVSEFQSPDSDNEKNYRHVRIKTLYAADVVDEPAANPDGLFYRQDEPRIAGDFLEFVAGLRDDTPDSFQGVDPKRARHFFMSWLSSHGLTLTPERDATPMSTDTPTPTIEAPAPVTRDQIVGELSRFTGKFGAENGTKWFQDNVSFEDACVKHIDVVEDQLSKANDRIAELETQLSEAKKAIGEDTPFDAGGESDPVDAGGKGDKFESLFGASDK